jgi:hypothetical protein
MKLDSLRVSRVVRFGALAAVLALTAPWMKAQTDPLPSWNNGAAKRAVLSFVKETTDTASPKFVKVEERIATFDQDGTLWTEHPSENRSRSLHLFNALHLWRGPTFIQNRLLRPVRPHV